MIKWSDYFYCDFDKGLLYWKKYVGGKSKKGKIAGCLDDHTNQGGGLRRRVKLQKNIYYTSRIIYEMKYDEIPEGLFIDHINGDPTDNSIKNLRLVDCTANSRNRKVASNSKSGWAGVIFARDKNKWRAYIGVGGGKCTNLGYYKNKNEAIIARKAAEKVLGYTTRGRQEEVE